MIILQKHFWNPFVIYCSSLWKVAALFITFFPFECWWKKWKKTLCFWTLRKISIQSHSRLQFSQRIYVYSWFFLTVYHLDLIWCENTYVVTLLLLLTCTSTLTLIPPAWMIFFSSYWNVRCVEQVWFVLIIEKHWPIRHERELATKYFSK